MKIAAIFGFIVSLPALLAAAPAAAREESGAREIRGQCEYADRFAPLLDQGDHAFALCDSVMIDRERQAFDFRRDSWGSMVRYEGTLSGNAMAVSRIQVRGADPRPATGNCRIRYRDGMVSGITCIATARGITHAANFVPSN